MNTMSDFLEWLKALFGHWQSWASGGGLGGAALILINLYERLRNWTMPKRWYALMFVFFFMLGASFMTWRDQRDQVRSERSETDGLRKRIEDLAQPKFEMHILSSLLGDQAKKSDSYAVVVARLNNLGSESSVPEDTWRMWVRSDDGVMHVGEAYTLKPGNNDFCMRSAGSSIVKARRFVAEDALYERATHVIPRNAYVAGVLEFVFPGLDYKTLLKPTNVLVIRWRDVLNREFSDEESVGSLAARVDQVFLPSLKYPTIIDSPSCRAVASK